VKKVLIIAPDRIAEQMAGPGVRYWNFALELSKYCRVSLVTKNPDHPLSDRIHEITHIKKINNFNKYVCSFDVILIQGLTMWEMPFLKKVNVPLIIDLYDPFILENLEKGIPYFDVYKKTVDILMEQLYYGDFFICASEKQRDFWLGAMASNLRINPLTYKEDPRLKNLLGVVPFGLPDFEPVKSNQVAKGVIDGIRTTDKLVIWWGGLWDWLDPVTLVKAMKLVSNSRKDIKCLIIGIKHPDPDFIPHDTIQKVLDTSDTLDLTNHCIFFKDWVDYEERMNYLLESDIGVSLHFDNLETKFSFRTRILDYLWSELCMVVTKGDTFSTLVEEYNLGMAIEPQNEQQLANAIIEILDNKEKFEVHFSLLKKQYIWSVVTKDLIEFCLNPKVAVDKKSIKKYLPKYSGKYRLYFMKTVQLLKQGNIALLLRKVKQKVNN
jgi:glycosyltransferase involved in cell wall biosynthesis